MKLKINQKFLDKNVDVEKLNHHMRKPEFLGTKRAFKLSWWAITNKPKFYYFYSLCECGISNMFAYNKTNASTREEIIEYIKKKHLND